MASLNDILERREARVRLRARLQQEHPWPAVVFSLNIPGPEKTGDRYNLIHKAGERELAAQLAAGTMEVIRRCIVYGACGREAFFIVRAGTRELKELCCRIEENHPLGRLFDMDVYEREGSPLRRSDLGKPSRRCFLCSAPAAECARSQRHSPSEMTAFIEAAVNAFFGT
ncbi:MAG: citrate lyase holo-[acyl-carrier protein] synthase [Sediminispirochaetaceae bacterium]